MGGYPIGVTWVRCDYFFRDSGDTIRHSYFASKLGARTHKVTGVDDLTRHSAGVEDKLSKAARSIA